MPLPPERAAKVERLIKDNAGPSELAADLDIVEADLRAVLNKEHPYWSDSVLLRKFLIARKLRVDETLQMLDAHAAWRQANIPVRITDPLIEELKKGKAEHYGTDAEGRPLIIVRSGRFDPKVRDLKVALAAVIYQVEKAIAWAGSSHTKFTIFYDRNGFSLRQNWDFEYIKAVVTMLSDNYPERLSGIYLYPSGHVLAGLVSLVKPFIDVRTRSKIHMITSDRLLLQLVPSEFVPVTSGGTSTHVFDPSIYDDLKAEGHAEPGQATDAVELS